MLRKSEIRARLFLNEIARKERREKEKYLCGRFVLEKREGKREARERNKGSAVCRGRAFV